MADNFLFSIGLLLVIAGFMIGVVAFIIAVARSMRGGGKMRGGGVIMIGPVPIMFGTDRESTRILVLLGVVLMVVFIVLTMLSVLWG